MDVHGSIRLDLLYSACRDGCVATTFHTRCDGQGPTISVGFSTDGWVYGGYASVSFASSGDWLQDSKAFLFRLRKEGHVDYVKCPGNNGHIYCDPTYGPVFGTPNGEEFRFFVNSHEKENNCFNLSSASDAHFDTKTFKYQNHGAAEIAGSCRKYRDIRVYKVTGTC